MPKISGKSIWAQAAFYTSLGFILPASVLSGFGLGWVLDHRFHKAPLFEVVLGILGAVGGVIEVLQILARAERDDEDDDSDNGAGSD